MKNILIVILLFSAVAIAGFVLFNSKSQTKETPPQNPIASPTTSEEKVEISASFTIVTGNITRSFKAEKYHNQSSDVYIEASDPTIVHVKKAGITWDDFFKTLPMKLTKMCLITGDRETLCDGENGNLIFYLNDIEDKNLLDKEIMSGDKALIKFSF